MIDGILIILLGAVLAVVFKSSPRPHLLVWDVAREGFDRLSISLLQATKSAREFNRVFSEVWPPEKREANRK